MANPGRMVETGVGIVIAITVALIMVAFVLTVALDEIAATTTDSWSEGAQSLFDLIDLIALLAIVLLLLGWALVTFRRG